MDVTQYIKAKSDQLNADDLMGGPITVQIMGVKEGSKEQPVIVEISGGHQPWKPSKTDRRVLVAAWGPEANQWIGRSITLYRDPNVMYAGVLVGGIRVSHLSHIDSDLTLMLAEVRGKRKERKIKRLVLSEPTKQAQQPDFKPVLSDAEFAEKLKSVSQAVADGKISPEASITRLEKTIILTESQKKQILGLGRQPEPEPTGDPASDPDDGMFD